MFPSCAKVPARGASPYKGKPLHAFKGKNISTSAKLGRSAFSFVISLLSYPNFIISAKSACIYLYHADFEN